MRSAALGQNFLRNRRTARRLVHLAGSAPEYLALDLGAGRGTIAEAALSIRPGSVRAVEKDARLAEVLRERFADESRVTVVEGDLLRVGIPKEVFVIAANPPFNVSTELVRRWMLHPLFRGAAIIVELQFAQRISGHYGATKLSTSLGPFLELAIPTRVQPSEFTPRPRADTAILTAHPRLHSTIGSEQRTEYFRFINYLFERSRYTVGESLSPLRIGIPRLLAEREVKALTPVDAVHLYLAMRAASPVAVSRMKQFEESLPPGRRSRLSDCKADPAHAT